jgi:hypothetical protein
MTPSRFAFYEEVIVEPAGSGLEEIAGELGVVLGVAEDGERWSYGVSIYSSGVTWTVTESDLKSTGRKRKREEFYDGTSIRVSQRGRLLE